jgi:hypothetical protein
MAVDGSFVKAPLYDLLAAGYTHESVQVRFHAQRFSLFVKPIQFRHLRPIVILLMLGND